MEEEIKVGVPKDPATTVGLEGCLQGVYVGNILLLQSPKVNVAGYVVAKNDAHVTLSFLDPNSALTWSEVYSLNYARTGLWGKADGIYNLRKFEHYQILKKEESNLGNAGEQGKIIEQHIRVGDIIQLKDVRVAIVGFVLYRNSSKVKLSHIDPNGQLRQYEQLYGKDYQKNLPLFSIEREFSTDSFKGVTTILHRPGEQPTTSSPVPE